MSGSYLMYKCRLCGETFAAGHAPDGDVARLVAHGMIEMPQKWYGDKPGLLTEHDCQGDAGTGLADLVGTVPDDGDLP